MRSILVQAGRDPGMTARLDTAMNLARAFEGHVTLLLDTPIDRYVTVDPYGGTYVAREALESALKRTTPWPKRSPDVCRTTTCRSTLPSMSCPRWMRWPAARGSPM